MTVTRALSTAISGLSASVSQVSSTAANIANVSTEGYSAVRSVQSTVVAGGGNGLDGGTAVQAQLLGGGGQPDLGQELVNLIEAKVSYELNASLFKAADALSRETLKLKA